MLHHYIPIFYCMSQHNRRIAAKRLKGFRDFLPHEMRLKQQILAAARAAATVAAFQEISTPALEYEEVLLGSSGAETDKQVYRFVDQGNRAVAMRYDLTVPFARFIAEHQNDLAFPFKRLQIGDVWRGENPQKGRYREFCQCDFDIVGADSAAADAEIIDVMMGVIQSLPCQGITLKINHRQILSAIIWAGLQQRPSESMETEVLIAIDKLEKVGAEQVRQLLTTSTSQLADAPADAAEFILAAINKTCRPQELRCLSDELCLMIRLRHPEALEGVSAGLARLMEVVQLFSASTSATTLIDLSIARGLGYYTGIVFETALSEPQGFGSIMSGGRYNHLTDRFMQRPMPGVGGSIGIDRLLAALQEHSIQMEQSQPALFVALTSEAVRVEATSLARQLRMRGCDVNIYLAEAKLGAQLKYADKLGYRCAMIVGETELSQGIFNIKDLQSGDSHSLHTLDNLLDFLTKTQHRSTS